MKKIKKANPNSPWRKKHGGLGPLSMPDPEANKDTHLTGVLDAEFFETPARLTRKELEELL